MSAHDDSLAAPVGFTVEWALGLHDESRKLVAERLPELEEAWPARGLRFDAYAQGGFMVLVVHPEPERMAATGPVSLVRRSDLPEPFPATVDDFSAWSLRVREHLNVARHAGVVLVPLPDDMEEVRGLRLDGLWDLLPETHRRMWSAAVSAYFLGGLSRLVEAPRSDVTSSEEAAHVQIVNPRYKQHPDLHPPSDPDQPIWRYMSMTKYLAMLSGATVHFARADTLGDPWEGAFGPFNRDRARELYGNAAADLAAFRGPTQRTINISCWHAQESESAAMWSAYAGWNPLNGEGIGVRTTFRRLIESLSSDADLFAGLVAYIDHASVFVPEDSLFAAFMRKRESFAHEREIRCLLMTSGTEAPVGIECQSTSPA